MGDERLPTVPGYTTGQLLGKGGMGAVYLATQDTLGREVAIKFMTNPATPGHETRAKRFLREAKTSANLRHPNIINVYDAGEIDGRLYMIMDYVQGPSLRKLIPCNLEHAMINRILFGMCRALQAAHAAGVVHRDIKPDNVLIAADDTPVLTDFGVVKLLDPAQTRLTKTGITLGSLPYMAPEQCQARDIDHRTDLYALGIVLYEMLEGKPPFRGNNPVIIATQHLTGEAKPLSENNVLYQGLVSKLLAKRPNRRIQTARDVFITLKKIAAAQQRAEAG